MKNSNEMVNSLLNRRQRYELEKLNRRRVQRRVLTPICCICFVAALSIGAWQSGVFDTERRTEANNTTVVDDAFKTEEINNIMYVYSRLEINGINYTDTDIPNVSAYTKDKFMGKVSNFSGEYNSGSNFKIGPNDSVYTVKETTDVIFVEKESGVIIVMVSADWSLSKYEPERLEPGYIAPEDLIGGNDNDFCHIIYTVDGNGNKTYVDPAYWD